MPRKKGNTSVFIFYYLIQSICDISAQISVYHLLCHLTSTIANASAEGENLLTQTCHRHTFKFTITNRLLQSSRKVFWVREGGYNFNTMLRSICCEAIPQRPDTTDAAVSQLSPVSHSQAPVEFRWLTARVKEDLLHHAKVFTLLTLFAWCHFTVQPLVLMCSIYIFL